METLNSWKLKAGDKIEAKVGIPDKLMEFFYLLIGLIFDIIKKEKPTEEEIDEIVNTAVDLWMEYLNIKFFPDVFERPIITTILRALILALVSYFIATKKIVRAKK